MALNACQWLVIGSMEHCGKNCRGAYCRIHNARLKRSRGTQPCRKCGKGVKNLFELCYGCGYHKAQMCDRYWRYKAARTEFCRLAAIDNSD